MHETLVKLLAADNPEIRAATVFTLGALVQVCCGGGDGVRVCVWGVYSICHRLGAFTLHVVC